MRKPSTPKAKAKDTRASAKKRPQQAEARGGFVLMRVLFGGAGHSPILRTSPRRSTSDFRVIVSRRFVSVAT
jgi:hypothetical protein